MKSINLITILSIGCFCVECCPIESDIYPCVCETQPNKQISISCVGEDINDDNIDDIMEAINNYLLSSPQTILRLFRLQKTSLTFVSEEVFGIIPFINIEIYDNQILNLSNFTENTLFASIYTLKSFYATNNDLFGSDGSHLLSVFKNFVFLQNLVIKENQIERISRKTFNNELQIYLKAIDLSSNRITSVEDYAFYSLMNLNYLNLSNNSLIELNANSFTLREWSTTPLQLYLNRNQLSANQLSEELFKKTNIKRPVILFLQNNKMHFLSENIFRPFLEYEKNYFIDIGDNPFLCDCERHKWLFLMSKHLRLKLLNMNCGSLSVWHFESLVIKNCFNN